MKINQFSFKKIKDSRKEETIEISVNGQKASSPSGKSTGSFEAKPYRKSLENSLKDLKKLSREIIGLEISSFEDLILLEKLIKKKFKLRKAQDFGANVLFALESATLKALAKSQKKKLWQVVNPKAKKFPLPVGNAIGGGLHSENYSNHPVFQEFEIIPKSKSPKENIKILNSVYKSLKKSLKASKKNDEGAWQCKLNNEEVLEIMSKEKRVKLGVDIAANSFYKDKEYCYKQKTLDKNLQILYIRSLIKKYNLFYVEDPLIEQDFQGFSKIQKNSKAFIVGDDLTATQPSRIKKAIKNKSITALIIKPNQNGSLLELKEIFDLCKKHKIKTILSHRSGETLDSALADLAVGFQADFIKAGISTKHREVKLKRLSEIEREIKNG